MIRGDIVVINFDESIPSWYLGRQLIDKAFKKEIQNIWIVEETYVSSALIKHISLNDKWNAPSDVKHIPTKYLILLDVARNNKIDKLLK